MSTENLFTTNCIRTNSGKYINVFDTNPEDINIEDIAHALSMIPRFGGHLPKFYSVGEHSLYVFRYVKKQYPNDYQLQLQALMHDATEAYLLDMPSPIKHRMPEYMAIENKLGAVIATKFGFEYPFHPVIKEADRSLLQKEWDALILGKDENFKFQVYEAQEIKQTFINTYNHLTK